jgi:hypothetical protein
MQPPEPIGHFRALVGGTVVHDDQLELKGLILDPEHRFNAGSERLFLVVARDYEAQHGGLFSIQCVHAASNNRRRRAVRRGSLSDRVKTSRNSEDVRH